jgi:CheY-like chemotaxis protein
MNQKFPILIADSDQAHVERLENALREVGFNNPFHVSRDGLDVLHYLQAGRPYEDRARYYFPRMMIMELDLPELSGFTLLAWLQEHEQCNVIPRVALTERASPEDVKRAYQLGVNTYFVKPPTQTGLVNIMRRLFDYWELAQLPALPAKC